MAFEFHHDIALQYRQQYENARDFILPFVEPHVRLGPGTAMMDIGCGTGGVLQAFAERGCFSLGVDLAAVTIDVARRQHAERIEQGLVEVLNQNIYDYHTDRKFDLIVFKDSIEHIPDQEKIIGHVRRFLAPGGKLFFGFPPWVMPFGGHQQIIRKSKLLSLLPWYHQLPKPIYKAILQTAGEEEHVVRELMEIKDLGISTYRFEKIVRRQKYKITARRLYFINPIYQYKFGLKPRVQMSAVSAIPGFRDFWTTCAYYLVEPE